MSWDWIIAAGVCVVFVALEGLMAGRGVKAALADIRQPRWAAPLPVWVALGIVYYGLCLATLARLLAHDSHAALWTGIVLIKLMAANAVWNLIFFRMRRFGWALAFNIAYILLFLIFWRRLAEVDPLMTRLWGLYAAYQIYAVAWGWAVWRLNRQGPAG